MFHNNFSKQNTKEIDIHEATKSIENVSIAGSLKVKSSKSHTAMSTMRSRKNSFVSESNGLTFANGGMGSENGLGDTFMEMQGTQGTDRKET